MKVLWIIENPLEEAYQLLNPNKKLINTRGWLQGLCDSLSTFDDIELYISSPCTVVNDLTILQGNYVTHILFPRCGDNRKYIPKYEYYFKRIYALIRPDVIHIHGTEYSQGLAYVNACGNEAVVVSIQGLISEIAKYYIAGIDNKTLKKHFTIGSFLFGLSMKKMKNLFYKRGKIEIDLLQKVTHVIGRTTWDYVHSHIINSNITYHKCNESLREDFYSGKWSYTECTKHSIFLSQSTYPVKGLHFVLEALPLVIKKYPDTRVRIAGTDITSINSIKDRLLLSQYSNYISFLIEKYNLKNYIEFTGLLDTNEIKKEYLKANLFILPSTIENSSNSLGEAQILGVPCIAAFVGGIPDMIPNEKCGKMYRCSDNRVLSHYICEVFKESCNYDNSESINEARSRHDRINNAGVMRDIYRDVKETRIK